MGAQFLNSKGINFFVNLIHWLNFNMQLNEYQGGSQGFFIVIVFVKW